jgi:Fe-S cluster biogenesis protein NfuA
MDTGASSATAAQSSGEGLRARVEAYFAERIRPAVQMDGGDVELVDVRDGVVTVRLWGACVTCSSSAITLYQGVERMLKEAFPGEVKAVEEAP